MSETDAHKAAEAFMEALHQLEETSDPAVMHDRFADDATLLALAKRREHHGKEGVEAFWNEYLKPFKEIHSEFTHVTAAGNLATLEWTGTGTLSEGRDVSYDGVSLLEFDGGGKVTRFRTYYDSAQFVTVASD